MQGGAKRSDKDSLEAPGAGKKLKVQQEGLMGDRPPDGKEAAEPGEGPGARAFGPPAFDPSAQAMALAVHARFAAAPPIRFMSLWVGPPGVAPGPSAASGPKAAAACLGPHRAAFRCTPKARYAWFDCPPVSPRKSGSRRGSLYAQADDRPTSLMTRLG